MELISAGPFDAFLQQVPKPTAGIGFAASPSRTMPACDARTAPAASAMKVTTPRISFGAFLCVHSFAVAGLSSVRDRLTTLCEHFWFQAFSLAYGRSLVVTVVAPMAELLPNVVAAVAAVVAVVAAVAELLLTMSWPSLWPWPNCCWLWLSSWP